MVANLLVTILDIIAGNLSFGAAGMEKLSVGAIAPPPGVTFAIWGIIFGWQLVFLVAQFNGCSCCALTRADVLQVTRRMIMVQLTQAAYGLTVYLVPDKGICLFIASIVITADLLALLYLQMQLCSYKLGLFFWLTFGYGINCAWLVVATYVQWTSLFVYTGLPMNVLQIPFLLSAVLLYCYLSLNPAFMYPPAFFCVGFWTFAFQAALWQPQAGADENFTEGVQDLYRAVVGAAAVLSLLGAVYVFHKKAQVDSQRSHIIFDSPSHAHVMT